MAGTCRTGHRQSPGHGTVATSAPALRQTVHNLGNRGINSYGFRPLSLAAPSLPPPSFRRPSAQGAPDALPILSYLSSLSLAVKLYTVQCIWISRSSAKRSYKRFCNLLHGFVAWFYPRDILCSMCPSASATAHHCRTALDGASYDTSHHLIYLRVRRWRCANAASRPAHSSARLLAAPGCPGTLCV